MITYNRYLKSQKKHIKAFFWLFFSVFLLQSFSKSLLAGDNEVVSTHESADAIGLYDQSAQQTVDEKVSNQAVIGQDYGEGFLDEADEEEEPTPFLKKKKVQLIGAAALTALGLGFCYWLKKSRHELEEETIQPPEKQTSEGEKTIPPVEKTIHLQEEHTANSTTVQSKVSQHPKAPTTSVNDLFQSQRPQKTETIDRLVVEKCQDIADKSIDGNVWYELTKMSSDELSSLLTREEDKRSFKAITDKMKPTYNDNTGYPLKYLTCPGITEQRLTLVEVNKLVDFMNTITANKRIRSAPEMAEYYKRAEQVADGQTRKALKYIDGRQLENLLLTPQNKNRFAFLTDKIGNGGHTFPLAYFNAKTLVDSLTMTEIEELAGLIDIITANKREKQECCDLVDELISRPGWKKCREMNGDQLKNLLLSRKDKEAFEAIATKVSGHYSPLSSLDKQDIAEKLTKEDIVEFSRLVDALAISLAEKEQKQKKCQAIADKCIPGEVWRGLIQMSGNQLTSLLRNEGDKGSFKAITDKLKTRYMDNTGYPLKYLTFPGVAEDALTLVEIDKLVDFIKTIAANERIRSDQEAAKRYKRAEQVADGHARTILKGINSSKLENLLQTPQNKRRFAFLTNKIRDCRYSLPLDYFNTRALVDSLTMTEIEEFAGLIDIMASNQGEKSERYELAVKLTRKEFWKKASTMDSSQLKNLFLNDEDKRAFNTIMVKIGSIDGQLSSFSAHHIAEMLTKKEITELDGLMGKLTDFSLVEEEQRQKKCQDVARKFMYSGAWYEFSEMPSSQLNSLLKSKEEQARFKAITDKIKPPYNDSGCPLNYIYSRTMKDNLTLAEVDELADLIGTIEKNNKERFEATKSTIPNNDELACPYCCNPYEDGDRVVSFCGFASHHTCETCLKEWLSKNATCPICRKPVTNTSILHMKFNKATGALKPDGAWQRGF